MGWYLQALRKYAVFSGRARRSEYWSFWLINLLICLGLFAIAGEQLFLPYVLATALPAAALTARRLHDANHSAWWLLITFIPFGSFVLFFFSIQDSSPGWNRYGPNPKGVTPEPDELSDPLPPAAEF
jgi:uncharacterized membrane protein YhaH (DUF805 family)